MEDCLVVGGADGAIGKAVVAALENCGHSCLVTSRDATRCALPPLHLDDAPEAWMPGLRVATVFVCAGLHPASCAADPAQARRMMVEGRSRWVREFARRGAFVVALSTNAVFDGTRPFEKTDAPTAPRGLYGAVHADFDNARGDFGNSLGIVRLTKVVTTESSTFRAWRAAAAARSTIVAPPDLRMAPVTLPFAASLIARCGIEKRVGLYHCSGERDIEYFAAASAFAERVGLPASNVLSKSVDALGIDPAVVTEYSSLDMSETISAYGVRGQSFADVADFIARA